MRADERRRVGMTRSPRGTHRGSLADMRMTPPSFQNTSDEEKDPSGYFPSAPTGRPFHRQPKLCAMRPNISEARPHADGRGRG